ncbi:hypothetical protein [Ornithinibacillus halotolerans]|uniref:Uncharacterized protein n=1 Tax=Ornithinibacillus halotolerans TaxID=1274357 RepID=A0A916WE27_9BACI|nr:hypothetical protein [Ornithinibacillus halotolerans]GGA89782.1 hypothetical protein GCM10008025_35490 [Ornithinibacillus halotolerans]
MKPYDDNHLDKDLRSLRDFKLSEQETSESFQAIQTRVRKDKNREKVRFYFSKTMAAFSTVIVLLVVGWFLYDVLSPEFQQATPQSASNMMDGIELEISLEKKTYSLDEEFIATVKITNHNDTERVVYVPTPIDVEDTISAVMVEKKEQLLWRILPPHSNEALPNIQGRSFYDYVKVTLAVNETIEQKFYWNKELIDQASQQTINTGQGEYLISTLILLDEITSQEDYYEPEKQLISKLEFTVNYGKKQKDVFSKDDCPDTDDPCINAVTANHAVRVFSGTSVLEIENENGQIRMTHGDFFGEIDEYLDTLEVTSNGDIMLDYINKVPEHLEVYFLDKDLERMEEVSLTKNTFNAPNKSGTYMFEIYGKYDNGTVHHYLEVKVK